MRVVLAAALLASAGCRIDLDHGEEARRCKTTNAAGDPIPVCDEAESHSDFAWIESKILSANCFGSSCHGSATATGKLDLSVGHAYATLMGATGAGVLSDVDKVHNLVVPGEPNKSYLFFMIRGVEATDGSPPFSTPPSTIGYMPSKSSVLCCQKIDAIERWILAGALND